MIIWILYGYGLYYPLQYPCWLIQKYGLYSCLLGITQKNTTFVGFKHDRRTGKSFTNKCGSGMTEGSLNLAERNFPENICFHDFCSQLYGGQIRISFFFLLLLLLFLLLLNIIIILPHKTNSNPAPPSYHHHNMSSVWLIILVIVPFGAVGDYHHPWTGVIPFFSATSIFRSDRSFWISVKSYDFSA